MIYLFIHLFLIQPIVHGGAPVIHLKMTISDSYASISPTCAILLKYYMGHYRLYSNFFVYVLLCEQISKQILWAGKLVYVHRRQLCHRVFAYGDTRYTIIRDCLDTCIICM